MTTNWTRDAVIYHIYPLGLCGAPAFNSAREPMQNRIENLYPWLEHIQSLGANTLLLGPVFQSGTHGYDTVNYHQVDRRLGNTEILAHFSKELHGRGLRLILDSVFNHVGRGFWAFEDVLEKGEESPYKDWFQNLRFHERSPKGDPFAYEGWNGHYDLVKLNLAHPDVQAHLFDAVATWMDQFEIDGLRVDAAECIDGAFLQSLSAFTKSRRSDFWLMGEVVHQDYRQYASPDKLHSVTNYECYKGLYSSLVDANYFEIAYALNRQSGMDGIYKDLQLYNFVDNHDVDRVASKLGNAALIYPLYLLLMTMPGIPSIYYGSEWGIEGRKEPHSDASLRPAIDLQSMQSNAPQPDLPRVIKQLANIRKEFKALRMGCYAQLLVTPQQFAFYRQWEEEIIVVVLNSASHSETVTLDMPWHSSEMIDVLNPGQTVRIESHRATFSLPSYWGRILRLIT